MADGGWRYYAFHPMVTPTDPGATPVPASADDAQTLLRAGLALGAARQGERAVPTLERAVALDPDLAEGWRALHGHLTTMGELDRARRAQARWLRALATEPSLRRAADALCEERFPEAEFLLKNHLRKHPDQPLALRLLAEAAFCRQRDEDAIRHLTRCLEVDPDMPGLRFARALACYRAGQPVTAQADLETALALRPDDAACRALLAAVLSKTSEIERTVRLYEDLAPEYPSQPKLWTSYGHVLKEPRFIDKPTRRANMSQMFELMARIAPERTTDEWLALMKQVNVPAMRVNRIHELPDDPQLRASGLIREREHPTEGSYLEVGMPVRFSAREPVPLRHAGRQGEHAEDVARELGVPVPPRAG